jgi:hypothetical protein
VGFRFFRWVAVAILVVAFALPAGARGGDLVTVVSPPGGTFNRGVEVSLAAGDGATIYYTIDGTEPNTDSAIFTHPIFVRTDSILRFFSVDAQGRREPVRQETYTFQLSEKLLDTTPPEATSDRAAGRYGVGEKVRLSANEEADIYFTLDGSEPSGNSPLFRDPISLQKGTVTVRFFAVDRAGNRSPVKSETYEVDADAPVTAAYPPGGTYRPPLGVKLTASKPGAVIRYTIDGSEPNGRSPVYGDSLLLSGRTTLRFFAMDDVGNRETVRKEEYYFDDAIPHTTAEPPAGEHPPPLAVKLVSKRGARIYYTTDGSTPSDDSRLFSAPIPVTGRITLRFMAVDQVGNREEPQTAEYGVLNGSWRLYARGVYMIPSVTDGKTFWMKNEGGPGVVRYRVGSGSRQVLGEKEGLLGRTVNDLVLDQKGTLWAATDQGLFRLEGERFAGFSREDGMPDRDVLSLGIDPDGTLWAGTRAGAARVKGDVIERIVTVKDGLPDGTVLAVEADAAGTKWFGTPKGLARWDGATWKTFTAASGLAGNEVRAVAVDSAWNVWAGGPAGLSRWDGSSWKSFRKDDGLPSDSVLLITTEQFGDVWVATAGGVVRYSQGRFILEERP